MKIKKCFKCRIDKPITEYYRHKQMLDGYLGKCKECTKKDTKDNPKTISKNENSYDRTEKGVIRVIYKTQKSNSKARGMDLPSYTKEELKDWLYDNGYKEIYDNYVKSNFDKWMKPSVDRKDDYKSYSLDNIQLGTWKDNQLHQNNDILNGLNKSGAICKPVLQFDINGNLLAEYVSFSSAYRINGFSMERSLKSGKPDRKTNSIWKYK